MKSTHSPSKRHRFSVGKRSLLVTIGLLVTLALSLLVWKAAICQTSQVAAAARNPKYVYYGHEFLTSDYEVTTPVYDTNDERLIIRVYATESAPECINPPNSFRFTYYDPQGHLTLACVESGCAVASYHPAFVDLYFWIAGGNREIGQYTVVVRDACLNPWWDNTLFTDYFEITSPQTYLYLPLVLKNYGP